MEKAVTQMVRDDEEMDLGNGHVFSQIVDQNGELVGWLHTHPDARSAGLRPCQSFCAVRPGFGPAVHEVVIIGPLTLSPSLKCRVCGAHGEVKEGKWVAC